MDTGQALTGILSFMVLMGFSFLAFWRLNPVLFLITGAIAIMFGFYAPDMLSGGITTPFSISVGMLLIAYSFLNIGLGYWFLLNPPSNKRGEDNG